MNPFPYQRIVVVGVTSSGKSTLAKSLAEKVGADFIELDALHWEPNWIEAPDDVFRERVDKATQAESWVVAGNYGKTRELIWLRADCLIWLDYPFHIVFWRLLTRTIRRAVIQEELWNGNRESFWGHLKLWSDDSSFKWLFKTYWRRKHELPILFTEPQHEHLKIFHFTSPRETQDWLGKLR